MSETKKITIKPNGPILVQGPLDITDPTGQSVPVEEGKTVAFCRCGASAAKPWCDGSHSRVGFQGSDPAPRK